jgi:hypothetical protein
MPKRCGAIAAKPSEDLRSADMQDQELKSVAAIFNAFFYAFFCAITKIIHLIILIVRHDD